MAVDSGDADADGSLRAPGADPAGRAERRESHAAVREALAELPQDLREVVHLRVFAGLDHEDIAAALGASAVAVRKRYSRALARLRGVLGSLAQAPDPKEVS
jgi:RNA polymerase sigma-70 factor (ECF subfamily)